ncbi:hypothetical protein PMAYCL1PPCAC_18870, partial [Pristionchus mayeri]
HTNEAHDLSHGDILGESMSWHCTRENSTDERVHVQFLLRDATSQTRDCLREGTVLLCCFHIGRLGGRDSRQLLLLALPFSLLRPTRARVPSPIALGILGARTASAISACAFWFDVGSRSTSDLADHCLGRLKRERTLGHLSSMTNYYLGSPLASPSSSRGSIVLIRVTTLLYLLLPLARHVVHAHIGFGYFLIGGLLIVEESVLVVAVLYVL